MPGPALHRQQQDELKAIQYLRQELAIWLSAEELKSLRKDLDLALGPFETPAARPHAITGKEVARALEAIAGYPQARRRFEELGGSSMRYQAPPGGQNPLPPGPLRVCPRDPTHYKRYVLKAGERLRCPKHRVDLVPHDQAGA